MSRLAIVCLLVGTCAAAAEQAATVRMIVRTEKADYYVLLYGQLSLAHARGAADARIAVYNKTGSLECFYDAPLRMRFADWRVDAEDSRPWGPRGREWLPDSMRWSWILPEAKPQRITVTLDDGANERSSGSLEHLAKNRPNPVVDALEAAQVPPAKHVFNPDDILPPATGQGEPAWRDPAEAFKSDTKPEPTK